MYRALHITLQRKVAIKVLRSEHNCGMEKLQRFLREAKIVSSLDHPNIVKVYSVGMVSTEQPYIAMEYLAGKQIGEIIGREGAFHWRKALPLFRQICEALEYAHKMKIIHRDIKPSNILLLPDQAAEQYCVKLLDFGIAKSLIETGPKLTQTDMVVGSAVYMSPEQIQGLPVTEHSDMYSLGCTFFEILSGQPPFSGDTVFETIAKQCNDAPPSMRQINESVDCPSDLEFVVQSMLRKEPLERPGSMSAVLQMLDKIQKGERLNHAALESRLPKKRVSRRIMVVVSLVVLVLVSALWAVDQSTRNSFGLFSASSTAKPDPVAQQLGASVKDASNGNDKTFYNAYAALVEHYKDNHQHLEAQMVAEEALERMSHGNTDLRRRMGRTVSEQYLITGRLDQAVQCFYKSSQPKSSERTNFMLRVYGVQGQWEKAAQNVPDQDAFFKKPPAAIRGPVIRWSTLSLNGAGRYSEALPWA